MNAVRLVICSERVEKAHNLYGAVPRARAEGIFGNEVPVHGEDLPLVLLPRLDREFIEHYIEELDRPIACSND